jgi:hypothetical protein
VQPEIPAHRRQRQEEREFQTSLGFLARPCLKKNKNKQNPWLHELCNFNQVPLHSLALK